MKIARGILTNQAMKRKIDQMVKEAMPQMVYELKQLMAQQAPEPTDMQGGSCQSGEGEGDEDHGTCEETLLISSSDNSKIKESQLNSSLGSAEVASAPTTPLAAAARAASE